MKRRAEGDVTSEVSKDRDLISELLKDVMGLVLERIPIQEAVRASVLARNWRYKWKSITKLMFGTEFMKFLASGRPLSCQNYFQTILNLLRRHEKIESLTLYVPKSDISAPLLTSVNDILFLVSHKGVKEFTIHYEYEYDVFAPRYSCSEMTRLKIINCVFLRPTGFNGFPNLLSLNCSSVFFDKDSFRFLFSGCPLIESLTLQSCSAPVSFNICSTKLKYLNVTVSSESVTNNNAPYLERLHLYSRDLGLYVYRHVTLKTTLHSLKELVFRCIYFEMLDDISFFFRLLDAAPNLEILDVATCPEIRSRDATNSTLKAKMDRKLEKLQTLRLKLLEAREEELCFLEGLLCLSPALKKVDVEVINFENKMSVTRKITDFPRASPVAELKFKDRSAI